MCESADLPGAMELLCNRIVNKYMSTTKQLDASLQWGVRIQTDDELLSTTSTAHINSATTTHRPQAQREETKHEEGKQVYAFRSLLGAALPFLCQTIRKASKVHFHLTDQPLVTVTSSLHLAPFTA